MIKQIFLCTTIAYVATFGTVKAQEPRDFNYLPRQTIQLPGTDYAIVFNSPELQVGERRQIRPLSAAVISWLVTNFNLPAIRDLPRVEYASPIDIAALQYTGLQATPKSGRFDLSFAFQAQYQMLTLYSEKSKTIYLPEGWNGSTPAELSIFVREMVRHVQNVAGLEYDCVQARELVAYAAQEKWLSMFGFKLQQEFKLSPEFVRMSTQCIPNS